MDKIVAAVAIAFWVLLLAGGALIVMSGNRSAQNFLGAILGATILTAVTDAFIPFYLAWYAYLAIDGTLLAIVLCYVVKSNVYWPIWFAGFHSIAVASQVSQLIFSGKVIGPYVDFAGFWSIPALVAMVWGVSLDRIKHKAVFQNNA